MNWGERSHDSLFYKWRWLLGLAFFVLVAYLPVGSFLFALKNDAFIYNFPNKFFFSQALEFGTTPYWNPYLNYGFPLFADPGFAWWQPLTWIFGWIGYTPYTFTIEVLVYIYIAAAGTYWMAKQFKISRPVAFMMSAMFACSGFFVGNLQHINFLTCAAFLPWLIGAWFNLQKQPSLKRALMAAFATYLLCTGGHPAIPIGTLYFMLAIAVMYLVSFRKNTRLKSFVGWNLCYAAITLLLLAPPIASWAQLMPMYGRNETIDQVSAGQLGFTITSYLSFLSPVVTIKNPSFFDTDVSMRNGYFSLIGFVVFAAALLSSQKPIQKIFLVAGLFMLLLSMGGSIKQFLYERLPLLNFIRTNGEFRVFPIICFITISGFSLDQLENDPTLRTRILKILKVISVASIVLAVAFTIVVMLGPPSGLSVFSISKAAFKAFLDKLTFSEAILFSVTGCLVLSTIYFYLLQKDKAIQFLLPLVLFDLIMNTWLLLPVTGVGSKNVAQIAALIQRAPQGFPTPPLEFITNSPPVTKEDELSIGSWSWYDKQIVHQPIEYPSQLRNSQSDLMMGDSSVTDKPFAFLKNKQGTLTVKSFSPTQIDFLVHLTAADTLILLQNKYPGWVILIDGERKRSDQSRQNFFSVPLKPASKSIMFRFRPFAD